MNPRRGPHKEPDALSDLGDPPLIRTDVRPLISNVLHAGDAPHDGMANTSDPVAIADAPPFPDLLTHSGDTNDVDPFG